MWTYLLRNWLNARHKVARLGLALGLSLCVALLGVRPSGAASNIRVTSRKHSYTFAQAINFSLEAKSDSPITEVILFYRVDDSPLARRIYPRFTPGTTVKCEHSEKVEPGQFAPGSMIQSWWILRAADGDKLMTDKQTFEYTDTNQNWRVLKGQRLDFYWYGRDEAAAKKLLERAEEVIARLEKEIGVSVERRLRIYSYNSQSDMRRALQQRSAGYDDRVMTLGVSVGNEGVLLLLGTHRDVNVTIAHELTHVVVDVATDNPYTDIPRWLSEGLAMYSEGELRAGNKQALEEAVRADKLLSIRSMTSYSGRASEVDLYYGQAHSIVSFMLKEFGRDKMQQLLSVFAEGARQEEALQRVYGFGLDELDNRWRASLGLGPRRRATTTPKTSGKQQASDGQPQFVAYSPAMSLKLLEGDLITIAPSGLGG